MVMKLLFFVFGAFWLVQYVHSNAIETKSDTNTTAGISINKTTDNDLTAENVEAAKWAYILTAISEIFDFHERTYNSSLDVFRPLIANYSFAGTENITKTVWVEKLQKMANLLEKINKSGDENKSEKNHFLRKLEEIFNGFEKTLVPLENLTELDKLIANAQDNLSIKIENNFVILSTNMIEAAEKFQNAIPPEKRQEEQIIIETAMKIKNATDLKQKFELLRSLLEFDNMSEKKN